MITTARILCVLQFAAVASLLRGQGTFQNLDFEMAKIVPVDGAPRFEVLASSALPGWTVYVGATPVNTVFYNTISAGAPVVSIHDSLSPISILQPLQGNYSVGIQHSTGGTPATAAISQ